MPKKKENTNGKTTYIVKLTFNDDEGKQIKEANLTVPVHMSLTEVVGILNNEHMMLNEKMPDGPYGKEGWRPCVLLQYVCDKYGWDWEDICYHIDMEFE